MRCIDRRRLYTIICHTWSDEGCTRTLNYHALHWETYLLKRDRFLGHPGSLGPFDIFCRPCLKRDRRTVKPRRKETEYTKTHQDQTVFETFSITIRVVWCLFGTKHILLPCTRFRKLSWRHNLLIRKVFVSFFYHQIRRHLCMKNVQPSLSVLVFCMTQVGVLLPHCLMNWRWFSFEIVDCCCEHKQNNTEKNGHQNFCINGIMQNV